MPYVPSPRRLSDGDYDKERPISTSIDFLRRPPRHIEDDRDELRLLKHNTTLNKIGDYSETPPVEELTYSIPLVRKKSGELVKSSIRLNMLLHETSRSLPTTPTSKQVHFGTDIDVKYFDEHDKPTTISASTSPYTSDYYSDSDNDLENDGTHNGIKSSDGGNNNGNFDHFDTSDDTLIVDDGIKSQFVKLVKASRACSQDDSSLKSMEKFKRAIEGWALDPTLLPPVSYSDKIDSEVPIFFERCFLSIEKTKIIGQIAVKNIAFSKSVTVRYTYNNWVNTINIDAQYTPDVPRNLRKNGYDRFSFQLSVPQIFSRYFGTNPIRGDIIRSPHFAFCIKLSANGMEFWDNNYHKNYQLQFVYKPQLISSNSKILNQNENTPEAMHMRYFQSTTNDGKKKDLKKSKSFIKSFSTSDLSELNDINLRVNDNFNYFKNTNESPLRLSIDSLKKTNLDYLNTKSNTNNNNSSSNASRGDNGNNEQFESVPLMRPERGSEIKRSNEGILDRLADKFEKLRADRIPQIVQNDNLEVIPSIPSVHINQKEDDENNVKVEPHSPIKHSHNPQHYTVHSPSAVNPTIIDPNQRDSSTYRNLVQKYCFFESPSNSKQHIPKDQQDSDRDSGIFMKFGNNNQLHHHHHRHNSNINNNNISVDSTNDKDNTCTTTKNDDEDKPKLLLENPFMDNGLDPEDYNMKHQDSSFGAFY